MKKTKNKFFSEYIFLVSFLISIFLFGAKTSFAAYLTDAQCTSQGGSCNWVSNTCNYDEDSVGLCQGGPLSQGACCKKKSIVPTGYLTDAQCTAKGGTCNWVFNSCNADEESVGLCQGGPTSQGACCKKKDNTITPNTGVGTTNPTTGGASPTAAGTAGAGGAGSGSGANTQSVPNGGLVPCGLNGAADCTLCHLVLGFKNIYDYLLYIVLLPATILVIVIAGIMYMVSSGDKGMIDKAKSALTYALTAMILALTAWLIINATLNALGYNKSGSWWNFTCDTTQTQGPTGGTGGGTLPGNPGFGNTGGTGCAAVVNNINSMAGSAYGSGNDCSSTTNRAYTNAGCKSPGGDSATMYANATQFTGANNLKAGDALVRVGHVGICLVDGCAQIMGASTANGIHPSSGSSMINDSSIRVIKVSDYCPASSC